VLTQLWQPDRAAWESKARDPFAEDGWELCHAESDFRFREDLATKHPDNLKELQIYS
jgi:hypothetical protein